MDPTSRAILLGGGGGPSGPEYIGTYKFETAQDYYNPLSWQVPADVFYIQGLAWGSGGYGYGGNVTGCYYFPGTSYCSGGIGGAGGFATAVIPVTAGEYLSIGVGNNSNNGGNSRGGGFTSIFRSSTPLLMAGGGGGGSAYGSSRANSSTTTPDDGGNGGGDPANAGHGGGYTNGMYLSGASHHGGGGYQGGTGHPFYGGGGGTGYIAATGNLHGSQETTPSSTFAAPQSSHPDYNGYANSSGLGNSNWSGGGLVIHTLGGGYNPALAPVIPNPRSVIATY